ncbi:hypothetical protein NIES22_33800 [Calothrix brevissima NIES-22]|nr:hypothetical protein NIES22_33800 [Calothrix brevissima NIES-22]
MLSQAKYIVVIYAASIVLFGRFILYIVAYFTTLKFVFQEYEHNM